MQPALIFWISQIKFICFISKHQKQPPGKNFWKLCNMKIFVWKIYITYASFYSNLQTLQTQKISIVENYPKTWYLLQISKDKLDNIDPAVYLSYT